MWILAGIFLAWIAPLTAPTLQAAQASAVSGASITFRYQNQKLVPSEYNIFIHEDGAGHYESMDGAGDAHPFQQDITITPNLLGNIFSVGRDHKLFAVACEATNLGRLAFQGKKTLSYDGPEGHGSCTFNYSKIKQIEQINDELQAVASTLEAGRRLREQMQHDRLGIDTELQNLEKNALSGRSSQLQNIRPVLQEIAADPDILNRARQLATALAANRERR